jgi:hypothetical protein
MYDSDARTVTVPAER